MRSDAFRGVWLRNHERASAGLVKALAEFFRDQAEAVASAVEANGTVGGADLLFRPDDWLEPLLATLEAGLDRVAVRGAATELEAFGEKAAHPAALDIPADVLDALRAFVDSALDAPHWAELNQQVRGDLAAALKAAVAEGDNLQETASRVRAALTGAGKVRAEKIARTETTGALNAGHQAGREHLASLGIVKGKEWLAIVDGDTRPSHHAANGQTVGVSEAFTIGGETCQHPGDLTLSAPERIHCRCTAISILAEELEAAG